MLDSDAARTEIAAHLWRYISAAASASPRPLTLRDIPLLLQADVDEIRVRSALAVLQAVGGDAVIDSVKETLRRLPTAIAFDREEMHGEVRGRIDWASTRLRAVNDPTAIVCRVPRRSSDLPANRTLKALIESYKAAVDTTIAAISHPTWGSRVAKVTDGPEALGERSAALAALLMHPKLLGVRTAKDMEPAQCERLVTLGLDPRLVVAEVLESMAADQETLALLPLITRHLLSPSEPSRLLEMLVAARVVRVFEELGFAPLPWRIIANDRRPFAELVDSTGSHWSVFWQRSHWSLPHIDRADSRYLATMTSAGVDANSLRPDLIIVPPSGRPLIFEVKYTETAERSRESDGVIDMMAYLWDMGVSTLAPDRPLGVVVAHGSAAVAGTSPILVCNEQIESLRTVVSRLVDFENAPTGHESSCSAPSEYG